MRATSRFRCYLTPMALLQSKCHTLEAEPDDVLELAAARRLAAGGGGRMIREGAGLSLNDVGRACGIHASTVLRWERAERRPRGLPALLYVRLMRDLADPKRGAGR